MVERVNGDRADGDKRRRWLFKRGTASWAHRTHARYKLSRKERLAQGVIRSGLQATDLIVDVVSLGHHDHQRVMVASHLATHSQSSHILHQGIKHDQIRWVLLPCTQRLFSARGTTDFIPTRL